MSARNGELWDETSTTGGGFRMRFTQTIAFRSFHEEQVKRLLDDWRRSGEKEAIGLERAVVLRDRERDDTYLIVAEFSSYDDAMKNNDLDATKEWADKMTKAVEGEVAYRNYDVIWE